MFYVHPYLGKIPIFTIFFQRGWNHQLDYSNWFFPKQHSSQKSVNPFSDPELRFYDAPKPFQQGVVHLIWTPGEIYRNFYIRNHQLKYEIECFKKTSKDWSMWRRYIFTIHLLSFTMWPQRNCSTKLEASPPQAWNWNLEEKSCHDIKRKGILYSIPWASTTITIMVDPIPMIKTLGYKQWWLY